MTVLAKAAPAAVRQRILFGLDAGPERVAPGPGEDQAVSRFTPGFQPDRIVPDKPRWDRSRSADALAYEDFDRPPPPPEPEVIAPSFSLADVQAAREQGFQDGRAAAAEEAAAADHAAIRETLAGIAAQLAGARELLLRQAEDVASAVAQVLLCSLEAILPTLAARYGEAELQAVMRAVLPGLFKEPAITVRLHPRHCGAVASEIQAFDPDLASRVQVVPSTNMAPGDVRIAWRNGGAARDIAALWSQVTEALGLAGLAPVAGRDVKELEHAG